MILLTHFMPPVYFYTNEKEKTKKVQKKTSSMKCEWLTEYYHQHNCADYCWWQKKKLSEKIFWDIAKRRNMWKHWNKKEHLYI